MSADGEFGFSRWVMHATGANGPFKLDGMDRTQSPRRAGLRELRLLRLEASSNNSSARE